MQGAGQEGGPSHLFELDPFGDLTASQISKAPGYFRIVKKGARRTAPVPDDQASAPSMAPPCPPEIELSATEYLSKNKVFHHFVEYLNGITEAVTIYDEDGTTAGATRAEARRGLYEDLRHIAEKALQDGNAVQALQGASEANGRFTGTLRAIPEESRIVNVKEDAGSAIGIEFDTGRIDLSDEKRRLLIDIARALTVVSVVLDRQVPGKKIGKHFALDRAYAASRAQEVRSKRNHYVRRLALLARTGLHEREAGYARLALEVFKEDFLALEADRVKNQYVKKLGFYCLGFAALFFGCWYLAITLLGYTSIVANGAPFFIAAIGACGGTWLSFAIRRVVLTFDDLALLENDRMAPASRVLFVVGLTWFVGLLLESSIAITEINGTRLDLSTNDLIALLIGAMCGIGERAVAGAVGGRSQDFAARIAAIPAAGGR